MSVNFIQDGDTIIAFFPESSRFFSVSEDTKNAICKIDQGATFEELKELGLDEATYENIKNTVDTCNIPLEHPVSSVKRIGRLALHLTNTCNLRCKYCYANGGTYKSEEGIMDIEVAKRALDCFYNEVESISLIQMFGGEPTMNLPVMKYVCEYVAKKNEERDVKAEMGMVTNGTLVTDELLELIKKYNLLVTVSFDGMPEVNDKLRVYKDGSGTSKKIIENIKKMREATGQPNTIEATYTKYHEEAGIKIKDIFDYIHENLGDIGLHIVPAGGTKDCGYRLDNNDAFIEAVDQMFDNAKDAESLQQYLYSLEERTIRAIIQKTYSKYICDGGIRNFSVSTKGDVYPCFIVTDEKELYMGNVFDEDLFRSEPFQKMRAKLDEFNKETNEECKNCIARKSCYACLGFSYINTGKMLTLENGMCDMIRAMTERSIAGIYKMSLWQE
ncbi:radical SAM/SPASM domain-containing protein [[Clostridium] polysaccharolyticum]|uniref:Radical SAM core domain-containing protein n=1 Tax=[Clostridium] polysaccharolyticum TaxID=29364 RepID=A0A1H9ZB42_9FIRM|nr:radical SAM protein [[Clostridium] polysaccharolyticum]SES78826.1 uncharacterized protein SAMN04487772_103109 [[Clostridium] polysaccharolyticum]